MKAVLLIALCNFGEARSLGLTGQLWQASTIWNNAGGDVGRLAQVAADPKLYSCWTGEYGAWLQGLDPAKLTGPDAVAWRRAEAIARRMVAGRFAPVNARVKYYRDNRISDAAFRRLFRRPLAVMAVIKNSTYYREEAS